MHLAPFYVNSQVNRVHKYFTKDDLSIIFNSIENYLASVGDPVPNYHKEIEAIDQLWGVIERSKEDYYEKFLVEFLHTLE